jgi:hypothetical protein
MVVGQQGGSDPLALLRWHRVPTPSHPVKATSTHPSPLVILGTRRFLVILVSSGGSSHIFCLDAPEQWQRPHRIQILPGFSAHRPIERQFRK